MICAGGGGEHSSIIALLLLGKLSKRISFFNIYMLRDRLSKAVERSSLESNYKILSKRNACLQECIQVNKKYT